MRRSQKLGRLLVLLSALVGCPSAVDLLDIHLHVRVAGSFEGGYCAPGRGFDCSKIVLSGWSELAGVPIALLGAAFFLAVAAVVLRSFWRSGEDTLAGRLWILSCYGLAILYCALLMAVSVLQLNALCPGCLALYLCVSVGALGAGLWRGEQKLSLARIGLSGDSLLFASVFACSVLVGLQLASLREESLRVGLQSGTEVEPEPGLDPDGVPFLGPPDAPLTVQIYSDFECGFCAEYAGWYTRLLDDFPDQVRIEFHHFVLPQHPRAADAARAAEAAYQQGRFWQYHDLLFAEDEPEYTLENLRGYAREAGLQLEAFDAYMNSPESVERLQSRQAHARRLGVQVTPTTIIGGRRLDRRPLYPELSALVEAALARQP